MAIEIDFTVQDLFASIGFDGARIAAVIGNHANGGPLPPLDEMIFFLKRMVEKAEQAKTLLDATVGTMNGELKLEANLEVSHPEQVN